MKKILLSISYLFYTITLFAQPGAVDPTFDPGTGTNASVLTTALTSDGKVLIGGQFTNFNGSPTARCHRLNTNGTSDVAFASFQNDLYKMLLQPDGKVIFAGTFTSCNIGGVVMINRIVRSNADGTIDNTFVTNTSTGADNTIQELALQSDGKILVGGFFNNYGGNTTFKLIRLNANGSPDYTMVVNGTSVNALAVQSDDKVLIGGNFSQVGGQSCPNFTRINSDMTDDAAFRANLGTGFNNVVHDIAIQSDGKIVVVGDFTQLNGSPAPRIVRLNQDGTRDNTFNPTGFNNIVYCVAVTADDQILAGGQFTQYVVGSNYHSLVMLNQDGTLDNTFSMNVQADAKVRSLSIQADGKIIVGGQFTQIGGASHAGIARLNGSCGASTSSSITESACFGYNAPDGVYYNQSGIYTAIIPNAAGCDSVITIDLTIIPNQTATISNNSGELIITSGIGTDYQWVDCQNFFSPILGATNNTFIPTVSGSYAVQIEANGCVSESNCVAVTVSTSSLTENVQLTIQIYPNPVIDLLSITSPNVTTAQITSSYGAVIANIELNGETTIDVSFYAPGIYFIHTAEGQMVKFIKE